MVLLTQGGARFPRICVALILAFAAQWASADSFNYISPADLKKELEAGAKPMLVDIQVEKEYAKHHLPNTLATYAYPAKSDAERARIKPFVERILASNKEVVIVCPGGGAGAENAYSYLKEQGVPEKRMRILEKGQNGWPYPEMLEKTK